MSKKTEWENPQDELLEISINRNSDIELIEESKEEPTEKDYITRNGKKYYKTDKAYVYKCEDGYYAYRIVHKPSKTNSFVNRHTDTKERFNTATKAHNALQEHIIKLEKNKTYKNRNVTFGEVWERIKDSSAKEEATITKYDTMPLNRLIASLSF